MKRTSVVIIALFLIAAGAWAQDPKAPPPQDTKDAKYTNESVARLRDRKSVV